MERKPQQQKNAKHEDDNPEPEKYDKADLEELCLWLYGIYEERTLKST